jgi:methylglutaconyl-CoA hydratase
MVRTERRGTALWIVMDRPDVRNALSAELMTKVREAVEGARDDAAVRSIVLTGAGSAFSAGADLNEMKSMVRASFEENVENALRLSETFYAIAASPKPVVARVNGPAVAGAVGLLSSCDVAIAVAGIRFSFSETRLGIAPAMISPFVIRRIGAARAQRLFLTAETFTAEEACSMGLVDRVVPPGELDAAVEKTVGDLAECAPGALAECKRIVARVVGATPEEAKRATAEAIARMRVGAEGQEGMAAFLEKRKPRWAE